MPHFSYVAYDANGKSTRGVIEGSSSVQVIERLQEKGLVVVDVSLSSGGKSRKVKNLTLENQTMFCRTLASYLRTGLPLADSLKILAKQTSERNVAAVFSALLESVEGGKRFSAALGDIGAFRESLVRMVESGEQSGSLVTVLEQSAVQFKLEETLRRKIKVALTYPVAMAVIGIAVVGFLLAYVVPKISALFQELGQKLPLPTRILIAASSFVQDYGLILLLVLLAALLVLRRRKKSLNPPFFRKIRSRLTLSLITSHLSTLLESGIPHELVDGPAEGSMDTHRRHGQGWAPLRQGSRKGRLLPGGGRLHHPRGGDGRGTVAGSPERLPEQLGGRRGTARASHESHRARHGSFTRGFSRVRRGLDPAPDLRSFESRPIMVSFANRGGIMKIDHSGGGFRAP